MVEPLRKKIIEQLMRASYFANPDKVGKDFFHKMEKTPLFTYPGYFSQELLRRLEGASSVASKSDNHVSAVTNFLLELFGPETPISSLVKLLEIPSVTGHEIHKARYLSSILMTFGVDSWVDRHGNVLGIIRGRTKETVLYEIHTDVIPPEEGQKVFIRDGRVWGRGSSDAQAGISEILYAARRLSMFSRFYPLKRNVLIVLDSGEEATTSEAKGFRSFIRAFKKGRIKKLKGLRIWAAVCGEPTSDDTGKVCIGVSSAGRVVLRIKSKGDRSEVQKAYRINIAGVSSHAAQPWKGQNVLRAMKSLASYLSSNGCEVADARAGTLEGGFINPSITNVIPKHGYITVSASSLKRSVLNRLIRAWRKKNKKFRIKSVDSITVPSPHYSNTLRGLELASRILALNNKLGSVKIAGVLARPTCSPTYFSAADGGTIVDFRVVGKMKPEDARRAVEEATGASAHILSSNNAAYTMEDGFLKMLETKSTKRVHVYYSHMLSYLQHELGVKRIFVVSGGSRDNLHTPNENAEIRMIIRSAHFLYSSLKRMCY